MKSSKHGKKKKKNKCPHCKGGSEVYRCYGRRYVYDVDEARKIVSDGREPVEVDSASVQQTVEDTRIHPKHLKHVDLRYPGIIAYVHAYQPTGEQVEGHLLIDGNHRAARSLQVGKPFYAYVLSRDESRSILLRSPSWPQFDNSMDC